MPSSLCVWFGFDTVLLARTHTPCMTLSPSPSIHLSRTPQCPAIVCEGAREAIRACYAATGCRGGELQGVAGDASECCSSAATGAGLSYHTGQECIDCFSTSCQCTSGTFFCMQEYIISYANYCLVCNTVYRL